MRDILIDFRDNMVSRGTISQNDILSLESMIGENIITDQKSINYFTQDSTQVGTQEVKEILDKKIENIEIKDAMDMHTFMETARNLVSAQEYVLDFITVKIGGLSQAVIDFFQDPKYKNIFIASDKGQELVEASNEHLYTLILSNSPFFCKLREVVGITDDAFDSFDNDIRTQDIKENDCQYEPLLNHILGDVVEPLTFNLLLKVKDNLDGIVKRIKDDIEYWKYMNNYENIKMYFTIGDSEKTIRHMNDDVSIYNTNSKSFRFLEKLLDLLNGKEK